MTGTTGPSGRTARIVVDGLTRTQIVQYAGASGDFNPIHTDEVYATQIAGFRTVLAPGMLTMGLVGVALAEVVEHDEIREFGGRFKAAVWPGDTLTVEVTVDGPSRDDGDGIRVELVARNSSGVEVFTGYASVGA